MASARAGSALRIFLYVPNLVGYVRLLFLLLATYYSQSAPNLFLVYYSLSYLLDMLDGFASRVLHQSSQFGAVFDMVLDRSSSGCLFGLLSSLYPRGGWLFLWLLILDISSHYAHLAAQHVHQRGSHKTTSAFEDGWLLHLYYSSRPVLAVLCFAQEAALLSLFALAQPASAHPLLGTVTLWRRLLYVALPLWLIKTAISAIQLYNACWRLALSDVHQDQGTPAAPASD